MSGTIFNDKPSSTINIKHAVPFVLDLDQMNYDVWRQLFELHCIGYGVDHHLQPPTQPQTEKEKEKTTAKSVAVKVNWTRMDSIVQSWIYGIRYSFHVSPSHDIQKANYCI